VRELRERRGNGARLSLPDPRADGAPSPGTPPGPGRDGIPARDDAGVRFPPPVLYAVPLLAGILLDLRWPLHVLPGAASHVVGAIGVTIGLALALSALGLFRRAGTSVIPRRPTTALVTSGPFRLTRNPMYVGLAFVYVGIAFWVNTAWPLLFFPLVVVLVRRLVIAREERYLEAKFGDAYRRYRRRVRRWL